MFSVRPCFKAYHTLALCSLFFSFVPTRFLSSSSGHDSFFLLHALLSRRQIYYFELTSTRQTVVTFRQYAPLIKFFRDVDIYARGKISYTFFKKWNQANVAKKLRHEVDKLSRVTGAWFEGSLLDNVRDLGCCQPAHRVIRVIRDRLPNPDIQDQQIKSMLVDVSSILSRMLS